MKNTIIGAIGEMFCPQSCISCGKVGGLLCECCKKYIMAGNNWRCLRCGKMLNCGICCGCGLPFRRQYYLGERDGLLKELVSLYKYQSMRSCATVFADLFFKMFGAFASGKVLIPLPTIEKHIRSRGFDHTTLLARRIMWRCGGRCERLLRRRNNTVQVGANAEMRQRQAASAYALAAAVDKKTEYVLLDDAWTTGSSMLAACAELQKAGAEKISVVLIARSG